MRVDVRLRHCNSVSHITEVFKAGRPFHTDHSSILHVSMFEKKRFKLCRRNLISLHLDQFLEKLLVKDTDLDERSD